MKYRLEYGLPQEDRHVSYPNLHLMLLAANRRAMFIALSRIVLIGTSLFLAGTAARSGIRRHLRVRILGSDCARCSSVESLFVSVDTFLSSHPTESIQFSPDCETAGGSAGDRRQRLDQFDRIARTESSQRQQEAHVDESIAKGEAVGRSISVEKAIEMRPAKRAAIIATLSFAGILIAYLLAPTVFGRGLARLIDPTGDHPPFTLVTFEVEVSPETIYHGSPASISARLSGPDLPDRADLSCLSTTANSSVFRCTAAVRMNTC